MTYDTDRIAYSLLRNEMQAVARKAAKEALLSFDSATVIDRVLPGLRNDVRASMISKGDLISANPEIFIDIYEREEPDFGADAFQMTFTEETPEVAPI